MKKQVALIFFLFLAPVFVIAQPLQIGQVNTRLYLQYSGEFSAPITEKNNLWNVLAGGGAAIEPASSALVDVTVIRIKKNHVAEKKISLVVKNKRTGRVIERSTVPLGIFGPAGQTHVGFWLSSVGCDPLELIASIGTLSKSQSLPFKCGE